MYRWVPVTPNMDHPNSQVIWSPIEITLLSPQYPVNLNISLSERKSLGIAFSDPAGGTCNVNSSTHCMTNSNSWSVQMALTSYPGSNFSQNNSLSGKFGPSEQFSVVCYPFWAILAENSFEPSHVSPFPPKIYKPFWAIFAEMILNTRLLSGDASPTPAPCLRICKPFVRHYALFYAGGSCVKKRTAETRLFLRCLFNCCRFICFKLGVFVPLNGENLINFQSISFLQLFIAAKTWQTRWKRKGGITFSFPEKQTSSEWTCPQKNPMEVRQCRVTGNFLCFFDQEGAKKWHFATEMIPETFSQVFCSFVFCDFFPKREEGLGDPETYFL